MDMSAVVAALTGIAGILGGFVGGRKTGGTQTISDAVSTFELLRLQVATLVDSNDLKEAKVTELTARVAVLESLITQRADVESVRGIVDRIAEKVGA